MNTKVTLLLAVASGFLGGIVSQRIQPAPVHAQDQPAPQEIRAHKFVLVDEAGVNRGVSGFGERRGSPYPTIEMMDPEARTWTMRGAFWHAGLLPDATCTACPHKKAK
jgi:hypothetical protein